MSSRGELTADKLTTESQEERIEREMTVRMLENGVEIESQEERIESTYSSCP